MRIRKLDVDLVNNKYYAEVEGEIFDMFDRFTLDVSINPDLRYSIIQYILRKEGKYYLILAKDLTEIDRRVITEDKAKELIKDKLLRNLVR